MSLSNLRMYQWSKLFHADVDYMYVDTTVEWQSVMYSEPYGAH